MKISVADRSSYYKGLLILIGRDRIIDSRERALMLQIGGMLDFDKRFCEAAMNDLLRNIHIKNEPVVFSQTELAQCFLQDAVRVAQVDKKIHPHELAWLKKVAQANGLTDESIDDAVRRCSEQSRTGQSTLLLIQKHL